MAVKRDPMYDNKRKVRTHDGRVGWVAAKLSEQLMSVQVERGGLYPVYDAHNLEDITDEEFYRLFR